jgi:hypothetical protein
MYEWLITSLDLREKAVQARKRHKDLFSATPPDEAEPEQDDAEDEEQDAGQSETQSGTRS